VQLVAVRMLLLQTAISAGPGTTAVFHAVVRLRLLALFALEISAPKIGRAPIRNAQAIAAVRLKNKVDEGGWVFIGSEFFFYVVIRGFSQLDFGLAWIGPGLYRLALF
jgi:hypothetical protein